MMNVMLEGVGWQMKNRAKESKDRKSWYSDECKKVKVMKALKLKNGSAKAITRRNEFVEKSAIQINRGGGGFCK
jgi:hypothetical protein